MSIFKAKQDPTKAILEAYKSGEYDLKEEETAL